MSDFYMDTKNPNLHPQAYVASALTHWAISAAHLLSFAVNQNCSKK